VADYREQPIDGNFLNVIKYPMGWVGVALEAFGVVCPNPDSRTQFSI